MVSSPPPPRDFEPRLRDFEPQDISYDVHRPSHTVGHRRPQSDRGASAGRRADRRSDRIAGQTLPVVCFLNFVQIHPVRERIYNVFESESTRFENEAATCPNPPGSQGRRSIDSHCDHTSGERERQEWRTNGRAPMRE